jgi:hypothetical protein
VRARPALLVLSCAALVGGCGNARTRPPDLSLPSPPGGFARQDFRAEGFSVVAPRAWRVTFGSAPMVLGAQSGLATLAIWRYRRAESPPRTRAALRRALGALLGAVRARDPSFQVVVAKVERVADRLGLVVLGLETIDGVRREVRSTHLFIRGAEVVIDAFAPPAVFKRTDRLTFLPVVRSLRPRHGG